MTHPKIQAWFDACDALAKAYAAQEQALKESENAEPPKNLRPATADDVKVGAIFWYVEDEPYWNVVQEVLHPNDPWKAYEAQDGGRYGLDGAMVEDDK